MFSLVTQSLVPFVPRFPPSLLISLIGVYVAVVSQWKNIYSCQHKFHQSQTLVLIFPFHSELSLFSISFLKKNRVWKTFEFFCLRIWIFFFSQILLRCFGSMKNKSIEYLLKYQWWGTIWDTLCHISEFFIMNVNINWRFVVLKLIDCKIKVILSSLKEKLLFIAY